MLGSVPNVELEAAVIDTSDPETYKNTRYFKRHTDIEDIYREWDNVVDPKVCHA